MLLLHQVLPDSALAVLFIRDEELERGGTAPVIRPDLPGVAAPRDPRAGGTWFGMSRCGFMAGLVNRRGDPEPAEARSRGRLMVEALRAPDLESSLETAANAVRKRPYGGCRLFAGDGRRLAWVDLPASGHPSAPHELGQGAWLMQHTRQPSEAPGLFRPEPGETTAGWFDRVRDLAADHHPQEAPFCQHGGEHGSVDLTEAALDSAGRPFLLRHLQGAPCSGDPEDFAALVGELAARR